MGGGGVGRHPAVQVCTVRIGSGCAGGRGTIPEPTLASLQISCTFAKLPNIPVCQPCVQAESPGPSPRSGEPAITLLACNTIMHVTGRPRAHMNSARAQVARRLHQDMVGGSSGPLRGAQHQSKFRWQKLARRSGHNPCLQCLHDELCGNSVHLLLHSTPPPPCRRSTLLQGHGLHGTARWLSEPATRLMEGLRSPKNGASETSAGGRSSQGSITRAAGAAAQLPPPLPDVCAA